jgi:hypothetical protein
MDLQDQQSDMKWLREDENFTLEMQIYTFSQEEHFQR